MRQIKNLAYIHDLGGTKTTDGRVIKNNMLFRSALLNEISEESVDYLADTCHIKHIIDLRTNEERKHKPEDFVSRRIEYHPIPLVTEENNPAVTKENRIQILNDLVNGEGGMRGHIYRLYRAIIGSDMAIEGYRQIFKILLNNKDGGVLFHCTQGKDRTGIVMMLILSALGVSRETIMKIYLSFNNRARLKRTAYFIGMNIRFSLKKAIALNDTLTARKKYLNVVFDEIDTKFNGIDEYLKNQIGLTKEDISSLKQIYLQ